MLTKRRTKPRTNPRTKRRTKSPLSNEIKISEFPTKKIHKSPLYNSTNSLKHLTIEAAQKDDQLGCFGKFCNNVKSKLTRTNTGGGGLPKLSEKDHELIIQHYGKVLPNTKKRKKNKAELLVAQKLCSCIKKIKKKSKKKSINSRAIGICSFAVVKNRGMKHHGFTCSKRSKIKKLSKTRKIVYKRPYKTKKKTKKKTRKKTKKKTKK